MQTILSMKPMLAVLTSLLAVPLILATGEKRPNLREFWSVLAGVIKFSIVISMAPLIFSGHTIEYTLISFYEGIDIKFRVDALGLIFATISSFLWIVTTFYSIGYMRSGKEHAQTRFYTCFAISLSATVGVAFSANLITLFVFYEILSLATVPLVGHKETPEAQEGAKKYFLYLLSLSKTLLLSGIIIIYMVAGTTDFQSHGLLQHMQGTPLLFVAFFLFLFGFAKAAVMPVHNWLPSAMVAPTPVSALLHAVAVVKVGVFSILRVVFHIYGIDLMAKSPSWHHNRLYCLVYHHHGVRDRPVKGQSQGQARLFNHQSAFLCHSGRGASDAGRHGRRHRPHRQPCLFQDHALFLRRVSLHGGAQDRDQSAVQYRQKNALDNDGIFYRIVEHDRGAAGRRICQQMVSGCSARLKPIKSPF